MSKRKIKIGDRFETKGSNKLMVIVDGISSRSNTVEYKVAHISGSSDTDLFLNDFDFICALPE